MAQSECLGLDKFPAVESKMCSHSKMKLKLGNSEDSLYIKVIKFASKYPQGFNYSDIVESKELNLELWEKNIVGRYFEDALRRNNASNNTIGETIFSFVHGQQGVYQSKENKFILTFEAEFAFIDYKELRFARKNSREARWLAIAAIIISIGIGLFQVFRIQDVSVTNDLIKTKMVK